MVAFYPGAQQLSTTMTTHAGLGAMPGRQDSAAFLVEANAPVIATPRRCHGRRQA